MRPAILRAAARGAAPPSCAGTPRSRGVSALVHQTQLDCQMPFARDRKTKIVATMGPSCLPILPQMLLAGVNVARINCAHGDAEQYKGIVAAVRAAEREVRRSGAAARATLAEGLSGARRDLAAVAFDVKGPEIRIGRFGADVPLKTAGNKEIALARGDRFVLTTDPRMSADGRKGLVYISYHNICKQVQKGQVIFVDDGNVELRVVEVDAAAGTLLVESVTSVGLGERKNVNLPGLTVDLPAVTAKDEVDLATARALGVDFIFASFVQSAAAVRQIRSLCAPETRIISKIESQAGIDAYEEILRASDGIMVARGDLGVQIPAERVFLAQKMMVARANVLGKVVICATQMLDSMMHSPRPTRAEVVDVASAVLDGADAVMLSGETAKGSFPLEAVGIMARTCAAAEAAFPSRAFFSALSEHPDVPVSVETDESLLFHETHQVRNWLANAATAGAEGGELSDEGAAQGEAESGLGDFMTIADVETLGSSAVHAAFETNAAAIVVISMSGRTAAMVAKYRPRAPVVCLVADEAVARQLMLRRGVHALLVPPAELDAAAAGEGGPSGAKLRAMALRMVKELGVAKKGDRVVVVQGQGAVPSIAVTLAQVH